MGLFEFALGPRRVRRKPASESVEMFSVSQVRQPIHQEDDNNIASNGSGCRCRLPLLAFSLLPLLK